MKPQPKIYEMPEEDQTIIDSRPGRILAAQGEKILEQAEKTPTEIEEEEAENEAHNQRLLENLRACINFKKLNPDQQQAIENSILARGKGDFFRGLADRTLTKALYNYVRNYTEKMARQKAEKPPKVPNQPWQLLSKRDRAETVLREQESDLAQLKLDNTRQRLRQMPKTSVPESYDDAPTIVQGPRLRSIPPPPPKKTFWQRMFG